MKTFSYRLDEAEIDDLVAFLASPASSRYSNWEPKELAHQREVVRAQRPQRYMARTFGPKAPRPAPRRP